VVTRELNSLTANFLHKQEENEREEFFKQDKNLPQQHDVSRDPLISNPLMKCLEVEPILQSSLERILKYIFLQPYSNDYNKMLINIMPQILALKDPIMEFGDFFIDSPEAE